MTGMHITSIREAVSETVRDAMRKDERLTLIVADRDMVQTHDGIADLEPSERAFHKEFGPWRVMRLPYAPDMVVGAALGAATGGLNVVADLTGLDDTSGLFDELMRYQASLQANDGEAVPALVMRARLGPNTPATHQFAGLAAQANLLDVALPATPSEAQGLMLEALRLRRPVLLLEQETPSDQDDMARFTSSPIPFGCAKELRKGDDITVIAFAPQVATALRASESLAESDGISCDVIDPRTMAPLDLRLIMGSIDRTGRLAVLEPAGHRCPIASEIVSRVAESGFSSLIAPIVRVPVAHNISSPTGVADALRRIYAHRD
jgi:pyruvate dehydrogenase E1 component beta subunit